MKTKSILAIIAIATLFATSCTRRDDHLLTPAGRNGSTGSTGSTTTPATSGSWPFKGATYVATDCFGAASELAAVNTGTTANVTFTFYGTKLPTSGGTYVVFNSASNANLTANQVLIATTVPITPGSASIPTYLSLGGTAMVTVTDGIVSIVGSGIQMINPDGDISTLSFNITQLQ